MVFLLTFRKEPFMKKMMKYCVFVSMFLSAALFAGTTFAQSNIWTGHYLKQGNVPINMNQAYFEALVCPTPSPTIAPSYYSETGNGILLKYNMNIPAYWPAGNLLLTGKVHYKGFWGPFVHVTDGRWTSAAAVNPSTAFTCNIPASSFMTFTQNGIALKPSVVLVKDQQIITSQTSSGSNGAEFAIPTDYRNVSSLAGVKGWLYRSHNFSAASPQTVNVTVAPGSFFKIYKYGVVGSGLPVVAVHETSNTIISYSGIGDPNNGQLNADASGQVEFAIPAGTKFRLGFPTVDGRIMSEVYTAPISSMRTVPLVSLNSPQLRAPANNITVQNGTSVHFEWSISLSNVTKYRVFLIDAATGNQYTATTTGITLDSPLPYAGTWIWLVQGLTSSDIPAAESSYRVINVSASKSSAASGGTQNTTSNKSASEFQKVDEKDYVQVDLSEFQSDKASKMQSVDLVLDLKSSAEKREFDLKNIFECIDPSGEIKILSIEESEKLAIENAESLPPAKIKFEFSFDSDDEIEEYDNMGSDEFFEYLDEEGLLFEDMFELYMNPWSLMDF